MSYPNIQDLVTTDREKQEVLYVYGRNGLRAGFRTAANIPKQVYGHPEFDVCSTLSEEAQKACKADPIEFFTSPIWFDNRSQPTDDLPSR